MLEHIGLSIINYSEIKEFYQDLLGFEIKKHFVISAELSEKVFGIKKKTPVYHLLKKDLDLELFIFPKEKVHSYNHLCISVKNRNELVTKAKDKGYDCLVIKRETSNYDLVFICDKSNNIFEIKEL